MKKFFLIIALLVWSVAAFAQIGKIPQRLELVTVDLEVGNEGSLLSTQENLEVFNMPVDGVNHYWLSVGHLGLGDDIIQFNIDPVSNLFIPLGGTLEEAQAKMEEIRGVANMAAGDGIETVGILAVGNPSTGEEEPVYLTARRFLFQKNVTFTVKRNGYVRSTDLARSDLGTMVSGIKFYRKIHPNEP